MLELVAKRAALRPSENLLSLSSENVSLPVLPPQTTINPLLQHQTPDTNAENQTLRSYHPRSSVHHTFSSQSHNQEHDVSSNLLDGIEHFYLRTNLSILHDCELLFEKFEHEATLQTHIKTTQGTRLNRHTFFLILGFLILYIGVIVYSVICMDPVV